LGGGTSYAGDVPARTAAEAALTPFFGVAGAYSAARNPWAAAGPAGFLREYYYAAAAFLAASPRGAWEMPVAKLFVWNLGSWDAQGARRRQRDDSVLSLVAQRRAARPPPPPPHRPSCSLFSHPTILLLRRRHAQTAARCAGVYPESAGYRDEAVCAAIRAHNAWAAPAAPTVWRYSETAGAGAAPPAPESE